MTLTRPRLEQGRSPTEVGNDNNLEVGRGALRSVIKAALDQEDEAWATSLREVGFSSGMSMAYEGVIAQLKHNKSLPCLHTLLTTSGLAMLKSAPLKHAFPICPPRAAPSCQALLASIRADIAAGRLSGSIWKQSAIWRPQVRRAFAKYHAMVKDVAEEIVTAPSFSKEYNIFLDSISRPINLFDLISQDFAAEFGPGACKGLLGVGSAGGDHLHQVRQICIHMSRLAAESIPDLEQIMDFCAARRPSELLARVKQRVAEKQDKEKARVVFEKKRARIEEIRKEEKILNERNSELREDRHEIKAETVALTGRRAALAKEREQLEREVDSEMTLAREVAGANKEKEAENDGLKPKQGSSKDLLYVTSSDTPIDPFSACAPRSLSPSPTSAKGKGRALTPLPGLVRFSYFPAPYVVLTWCISCNSRDLLLDTKVEPRLPLDPSQSYRSLRLQLRVLQSHRHSPLLLLHLPLYDPARSQSHQLGDSQLNRIPPLSLRLTPSTNRAVRRVQRKCFKRRWRRCYISRSQLRLLLCLLVPCSDLTPNQPFRLRRHNDLSHLARLVLLSSEMQRRK